MKSQNLIVAVIVLLILGIILVPLFAGKPEVAHVFPATVNRECAPWDGAAFAVSFRYDPLTTITIFIWKSPNFRLPVTFSFPDEMMSTGIAYSVMELDPWEELTGKVTFQRVEVGVPLEGKFSFTSARGEIYEGRFLAEWGNQIVYCG